MRSAAYQLREHVRRLTFELKSAEAAVARLEMDCTHRWSAPVSDPIVREGYHDPGDPEGTMGIDRRLPMDVPTQRTPRWRRECEECGRVEHTTSATDHVTKVPRF